MVVLKKKSAKVYLGARFENKFGEEPSLLVVRMLAAIVLGHISYSG